MYSEFWMSADSSFSLQVPSTGGRWNHRWKSNPTTWEEVRQEEGYPQSTSSGSLATHQHSHAGTHSRQNSQVPTTDLRGVGPTTFGHQLRWKNKRTRITVGFYFLFITIKKFFINVVFCRIFCWQNEFFSSPSLLWFNLWSPFYEKTSWFCFFDGLSFFIAQKINFWTYSVN